MFNHDTDLSSNPALARAIGRPAIPAWNQDRAPLDFSFDIRRWWRCNINILIVTDSSSGGYGNSAGFHLGLVLDIIEDEDWGHVKFNFTKAHRRTVGSGPVDHENFRFDNHNLNQYSQIWLFGIDRAADPLSDSELKALTQFMNDRKGGVFATGDHENLGLPLAGRVPRVRSMRRWHHPNPGPNGEPVAPDWKGAGRHDTIIQPGNQTDKTPQFIVPKLYKRTRRHRFITTTARYPHPVLCGPSGPINYLPDHMHEGLCEVPASLTGTFSFDGYSGDEYPKVGGHREAPDVIATSQSHGTNATNFGALAAYDGHRVGVGRVLVDATWHHWFNVNMRGYINASDPAHPAYDPAAVAPWEEIKAYFRNVGVWLATPSLQKCLRNGGWLAVAKFHDFAPNFQRMSVIRDRLDYFFGIGIVARDALGRLASQCQTVSWAVEALEHHELLPEPWVNPRPGNPYWIDPEQLETLILGGAVQAVAEKFGDDDVGKLMDKSVEKVDAVARKGAHHAVALYLDRVEDEAARLTKARKKIDYRARKKQK